jgi:hypothetical protein
MQSYSVIFSQRPKRHGLIFQISHIQPIFSHISLSHFCVKSNIQPNSAIFWRILKLVL